VEKLYQGVDKMNKKPYYVSVPGPGTGEVRSEKGESSYDFEINATEDEAYELKEFFEKAYSDDMKTYLHMHIVPVIPNSIDKDHKEYDDSFNTIYQKIYELGTENTKEQIEQMGILNALKGAPGNQSGPSMLQ
jgi:hypothetical protein